MVLVDLQPPVLIQSKTLWELLFGKRRITETTFTDGISDISTHTCKSRTWGLALEYPATIVLDLTAHVFLKNEECAGINYKEWLGILKLYRTWYQTNLQIKEVLGSKVCFRRK